MAQGMTRSAIVLNRISKPTFLRGLAASLLLLAALLGPGLTAPAAPPGGAEGAAAESRPAGERSLRVMTFNIRQGTAQDGPDRWEVRKTRLIEVMRRHPAEVIGLQEALAGQIDDLRAAFPRHQFLGAGRRDGRAGGEFSALMYDTSRLQVLRSDTFWLSDTPRVPRSKHWGNKIERICTWAHFRDLKTGACFYVYNTHLDHESQPSREKSAELLLRRIEARLPKDPVIVTGDLNSGENNPVHETLRRAGFRDTFRVLHPEATAAGTFNGFRERRGRNKLDYIYADSAWSVSKADIVTDKIDGRWPSDHLPVMATVSLR